MVKVRVIGTGASALALLGVHELGCAAPTAPESDAESAAAALTNAGTGTLDLQATYGTPAFLFQATNSTDEFVRTGEKMTIGLPAVTLWERLHPTDPLPDVARLQQLTASVKVSHLHAGAAYKTSTVVTSSWSGTDQPWALTAHSGAFTVGAKADTLSFDVAITDKGAPGVTAHIAASDLLAVPVFGGELPKKHAIFDTLYAASRQRVVEGGSPVAGADVVLTYTDWRGATLVDEASIDREIGTVTAYGRFGPYTMPIYGDLAYDVSFGVDFGDGVGFHPEAPLPATPTSRLLPPFGRTGYEAPISVPATATKVDLYLHVKATLIVDYTKYQNVTERRYAQGDRILMREKWDNAGGVAGQNYALGVEGGK
jgi:hypothetical protein